MSHLTATIPAELWLSANQRLHWAPKSHRTKSIRSIGWATASASGMRDANLGTTHVAAFIAYPRNGRADPANAAPTVKALIDGMVDAGVWADDDSTHILGPTYLRDPKTGTSSYRVRLVLTAQDVPWLGTSCQVCGEPADDTVCAGCGGAA